jgi:hypothetical protein
MFRRKGRTIPEGWMATTYVSGNIFEDLIE